MPRKKIFFPFFVLFLFAYNFAYSFQGFSDWPRREMLSVSDNITDIRVKFDSEEKMNKYLKEADIKKGEFKIISKELSQSIINNLKVEYGVELGGSLLNTSAVLADLGVEVSAVTTVGKDKYGDFSQEDLWGRGVKTFIQYCPIHGTSVSLVLIAPDGERTMLTTTGCSGEFKEENFDYRLARDKKMVIAESFLFNSPNFRKIVPELFKYSSREGVDTVLTLSNKLVVSNFRELIEKVLGNTDIVIGSREEFFALVQASDMEDLIKKLQCTKRLNVVTLDKDGVLVVDDRGEKKVVFKLPTTSDKPIDSTGAGDNFAAGFLYGYLKGYSLNRCAELGNRIAGAVIKQMGARVNNPKSLLENYFQ